MRRVCEGESQLRLILLSGDENMCIVDTDSKTQEEDCRKVIRIHFCLIQYSDMLIIIAPLFPPHPGVESEIIR